MLLLLTFTGSARAAQTITVVNWAGASPIALHRVERAVARQSWQLAYWWHTQPIRFGPGGWKVYLEQYDGTGILGWHATTVRSGPAPGHICECSFVYGPPFAHVMTNWASWQTWSYEFSHEVMEMVANPRSDGIHHEICDPVWWKTYRIDGVRVADFMLPNGLDLMSEDQRIPVHAVPVQT